MLDGFESKDDSLPVWIPTALATIAVGMTVLGLSDHDVIASLVLTAGAGVIAIVAVWISPRTRARVRAVVLGVAAGYAIVAVTMCSLFLVFGGG